MATKQKNTYGPRRKFKGRMVNRSGVPRACDMQTLPGKKDKFPRVHCSGGGIALSGWTQGDQAVEAIDTKHVAGRYRVVMPRKLFKYGTKASIVRDED